MWDEKKAGLIFCVLSVLILSISPAMAECNGTLDCFVDSVSNVDWIEVLTLGHIHSSTGFTYNVSDELLYDNLAKKIRFDSLPSESFNLSLEASKQSKNPSELLNIDITRHSGDAKVALMEKVNVTKERIVESYECNCRDKIEFSNATNESKKATQETVRICDTCYKYENYTEEVMREINPENFVLKEGDSVYEVFEGCTEIGELEDGTWGCSVWTDPYILGEKIEGATWWNSTWTKRKELNITSSTDVLTDFQILLNITYESDMNSTYKDLRFTNATGTILDYWIEEYNSTRAMVWLEADSISNTTNTTFYMYYGNSEASAASNITNTMVFGDDFSGSSIDTDKWDYEDNLPSVSGGVATFSRPAGTDQESCGIMAKSALSSGSYIVRTKLKWGSVSDNVRRYTSFGFGGQYEFFKTVVGAGLRDYGSSNKELWIQEWDLEDNAGGGEVASSVLGNVHTTYKTYELIVPVSGDLVLKCVDDSTSVSKSHDYSTVLKPSIGIGSYGGSQTKDAISVDSEYILVRKYTSTDPTYSFGSEEVPVSALFSVQLLSPTNGSSTNDSTPMFGFNVSGSETNYSCELVINDTGYGENVSYLCYQEHANVSTECGGLDSGSYSCSGTWNYGGCANTYDGDWDTSAGSQDGASVEITYSKPPGATIDSLWQARGYYPSNSWVNISIPDSCWDNDPDTLSLKMYSRYQADIGTDFFCYNGTDWQIIDELPWGYLYEEAMWWDIRHQTTMNNTETYIEANSSLVDGTYDWWIDCSVGSSHNLSEVRELSIYAIPSFSGYQIGPEPPNEDQGVEINVTVIGAGVSEVILEWNGSINHTVTTYSGDEYYFTIASSNYTAHDEVTYYWYATNPAGTGKSEQQSFTIANQIPTLSSPALNDTTPQTNNILNCTGGTFSDNDAEDSESSREFKWYDGISEISGQTSQTLDLSVSGLDKSDLIKCSARVSDGYNWSVWVNSSNVATIQNTLPSTPTGLDLTNPVYVTDTLTATGSGSTDDDSDGITYYYKFYNLNESTIRQDWGVDNTYVIQQSDAHDTIRVYTRANDGTGNSGEYYSDRSVSDTSPTAPTSGNPTDPAYVGTNMAMTCSGSTDTDGDSITYYYEFYNTNSSTTLRPYSIDNSYVVQQSNAHDQIRVRCKAVTSLSNSTEYTQLRNISNSAPVITAYLVSQSKDADGTAWEYNYDATDADGDTLTWSDNTSLFNINSEFGEIYDIPTESEAGTYSILITVSDSEDQDTDTFMYTINDINPPELQFNPSSTDGISSHNWVFINISVSDPNFDTVVLEWDGANESFDNNDGTNHWENKTGLSSGTYSITVYANDSSGNLNQTERTVILDMTPPTSNSPADTTFVRCSESTLGWILTDEVQAGMYYVERNGTLQNSSTSWTNNTNLNVGVNTSDLGYWNYTIFFNDSAGNEGTPDTVIVSIVSGFNLSAYYDNGTAATNWTLTITNGTSNYTESNINNPKLLCGEEIPSGNITLTVDDGSDTLYYFQNSTTAINDNLHFEIINFTLSLKPENDLVLLSSPSWSVWVGESVGISCLSSEGTPNLYIQTILVSNPYSLTTAEGTYFVSCNISETDNYRPTTINNTLISTSPLQCTSNNTYAFSAIISTSTNITTVNLSDIRELNYVREDLGDVWSEDVRGMWVNTTNGYYVIVNNTGTYNFTLNFGNYFITHNHSSAEIQNCIDLPTYEQENIYAIYNLKDEITGEPNFPPNATLLGYLSCSLGQNYISIANNTTTFLVAMEDHLDKTSIRVQYTADAYYSRARYPEPQEQYYFDMYVADAYTYALDRIDFSMLDTTYYDAKLQIYREYSGLPIIITEGYFDVSHQLSIYLMEDADYDIRACVESTCTEFGIISVVEPTAKELGRQTLMTSPSAVLIADNLLMDANVENDTLWIRYLDYMNQTERVNITVLYSNGSTFQFLNYTSDSVFLNYNLTELGLENETFWVEFGVDHETLGNSPVQYSLSASAVKEWIVGETSYLYEIFAVVLLVCIGGTATRENLLAGMLLYVSGLAIFIGIGWISVPMVYLGVMGILFVLGIAAYVKQGGE